MEGPAVRSMIERRCRFPAALAALLLLCCAPPMHAQGYQASRIAAVNGRQVFEVRMGIVPGNQTLRTLVITAGPVAGSTSLLAAATPAADLMNPTVPMPFSVVVNSGGLYSLAGGCPRAGELNFPYIDGTQFRIVRYTGTTQTIVTPPAVAGQFESVNCTTSANGQAVFYILANRTTARIEVWREGAGNSFTRVHAGSVAIRLPFSGGLRPQVSKMARRPVPTTNGMPEASGASGDGFETAYILTAHHKVGGEMYVEVVDVASGSVVGSCYVSTQPPGRPPPAEAWLTSTGQLIGDFDGDGFAEFVEVVAEPGVIGVPSCLGAVVNIGSSAGGNGYGWTGYAVAGTDTNVIMFNGTGEWEIAFGGGTSHGTSPYAGRGGPFHAAYLRAGEIAPGILAVGTSANNSQLEFYARAPAFSSNQTGIQSSFEDFLDGYRIIFNEGPDRPR